MSLIWMFARASREAESRRRYGTEYFHVITHLISQVLAYSTGKELCPGNNVCTFGKRSPSSTSPETTRRQLALRYHSNPFKALTGKSWSILVHLLAFVRHYALALAKQCAVETLALVRPYAVNALVQTQRFAVKRRASFRGSLAGSLAGSQAGASWAFPLYYTQS